MSVLVKHSRAEYYMLERLKSMGLSLAGNTQLLTILFLIAVLIVITLWVYKKYISPKLQTSYAPNKEYIKSETSKSVDLYLFYTEWCPHCKKAMPEWSNLKQSIGDSQVNGYDVNFIEVDCEKEKALADQFKVEGYPTIKMVKDGQTIEYDARPDTNTLIKFLQTMTEK